MNPRVIVLCLLWCGFLSSAQACPACRGNIDVLREFAIVEGKIVAAEKAGKFEAMRKGAPSGTIINTWAKKEAAGGMHSGKLFAHMIFTDTQQRLELSFSNGQARVSPASETQPEVLFITSVSALNAMNRGRVTLEDAIAEGWFVSIDPALTSGDKR